ncbi:hypothetical protein AAG906_024725 [Vitis piasezkii]
MEAVGDALLSAAIGLLFDKLASTDLLDFARQQWVYSDLKKWEIELSDIREELNDAEDKQITDRSVKEWLGNLKDMAYDMEDVLDEFAYEALQRELTAKEADHQGRPSKVRKLISTCLGIFNPTEVMRYIKMRSKVYEITRRLRDISAQNLNFGDRKDIIIGMLLTNEPTKTNFSVVSIVAMGGMGKTTLARLVYNDDETITKHFDKKPGITKTILNSVTNSQSSDSQDLHQIQENLRKELKEKISDIGQAMLPFWVGAQGSKILVTTRNNDVANKMRGHKNLHELKQLPYDDCLKIFQTHAFEHMNIDEHPNLESIGRRIVEKCGGSPLAARALGGLLRSELRECEWERVLYSKVWDFTDKECDIIPALRLSYYHLSSHLKRFYKARVNPHVDGGGLIQQSKDNRKMEDLVQNNLQHLIPKTTRHSSFVRDDYDTFKKFERFHEKEHLRTFIAISTPRFIDTQFIRHLRVLSLSGYRINEIPNEFGNLKLLRLPSLKKLTVDECNETVLRSGIELTSLTELRVSGILELIKLQQGFVRSLGGLQALKFSECEELTCLWEDGFESESLHCHQLVPSGCNLRSLKISSCDKLERLPNGWQSLTCLEELKIKYCPKLVSFPEVGFPPKLRSLILRNCESLKCLPDGMMRNSNGSSNSCVLESLEITQCSSLICFPKGQLPTTLKKLIIGECENLMSLPEGMMHCNSIATTSTMDMCALEFLSLNMCPSLIGFPRGRLPITLKELYISDCEKLESLPEGIMHYDSTNVAALQSLAISHCSSLTSFPRGKFPSTLKGLNIWDCEHLESISEQMFHSTNNSFQSLSIGRYPNLRALPNCLYNLTDLYIANNKNLKLLPLIKNLTCLTSFFISHCENIKTPLSQWGLSRLTSLENLSIEDMFPYATSFSDDPHLIVLPTTLTSLHISHFHNLESLASLSLQTLTSLRRLVPDSLSELRIWGRKDMIGPRLLISPAWRYMTNPSLSNKTVCSNRLHILLEQQCQRRCTLYEYLKRII